MAKVSKRAKKEEVLVENKNVLNNSEILKVETLPLIVENAKYFMAIQEQNLANLILEYKLLAEKIEKQKIVVQEANQKYQQAKVNYNGVLQEIMKNHSLTSDKFGYNSATGEIII